MSLDQIGVFVSELGQEQAAKSQYPDGVAASIVPLLDTVPVNVAQCLCEAHAEETPALALSRAAAQSPIAVVRSVRTVA